jgi:hypothetical protein
MQVCMDGEYAVRRVLCLTAAELPLLGTLKIRRHILAHRKALAKRLNAEGSLGSATTRSSPASLPTP